MLNVYSIYDKDTGKYGQPFFAETDAVAKRQFLIGCKSLPKEILVALKFFQHMLIWILLISQMIRNLSCQVMMF